MRVRRSAVRLGGDLVGPAALTLLLLPFAFGAGHPAGAARSDHATPGDVVSLDLAARQDTVDLLVAIRTPQGHELRHQRSRDGGATWSSAARLPIGASEIHAPHRGADAQIGAAGQRLVVLWTRPGTSAWGSGPIGSALSGDGGVTWTVGPNPADDGSGAGHGYLAVVADPAGVFHAAWLDTRDGAQGLRAAVSRDFGRTWEANRDVDARTCECCWNRLAASRAGHVAILYRDHDPRDMALAVLPRGARNWERRGAVGAFEWRFEGCPHVGGGLAYTERSLHALVWTGRKGRAGLHALASPDDGRHWSEPRRVGGPAAHHPDLAASGARLAAAWDDAGKTQRSVQIAVSSDDGETWSKARRLSAPGAEASHPRVVGLSGARFLVAWTERTGDGVIAWRSTVIDAR